ncbi:MAG: hypothetical protein R3E08_05150 [Thiotrichaceae bacterium]
MEWLERLTYQTVALDTAPLIYFIEDHPRYSQIVIPCVSFFSLPSSTWQRLLKSSASFIPI